MNLQNLTTLALLNAALATQVAANKLLVSFRPYVIQNGDNYAVNFAVAHSEAAETADAIIAYTGTNIETIEDTIQAYETANTVVAVCEVHVLSLKNGDFNTPTFVVLARYS